MSLRVLSVAVGLVSSVSANFLFPRNNPPQPPCTYPYTKFVYSGCFHDSVDSRSLPFMAELEFTNATIEQCTAYCKGNNYRYAGLEYYGQCFCGASVASTSAPEAECNLPCNGDKSQACGGEDRLSIYQDPTFLDTEDVAVSSNYLSLGCYTEGTSGRSLDYSQWDFLNISAMTTQTCLNACGAKGYPFAGTEFGRECYCGVVLGNGTVSATASECSTPCTGNSTQMCGGPNRLSLYVAKNLESTEPCGPPIISSSSSSTPTPTPSLSSSSKSLSLPKASTTSKCYGYGCPSSPSSPKPSSTPKPTSSKCYGYGCPLPPSPPKTSTSSKCVGYYCPWPPKPSSSKCVGYHCAQPKPTCKTTVPTPKPSVTTIVKVTTVCKTSSTLKTTPKSTPKATSTKGYGYGGWP